LLDKKKVMEEDEQREIDAEHGAADCNAQWSGGNDMEIKVLGMGCAKCKKLEKVTREVVAEYSIDATVTKVTDPAKILRYPIIAVPGLVVDEEIKAFGRIPNKQEIARWLAEAEAEAEHVPTDTTDA